MIRNEGGYARIFYNDGNREDKARLNGTQVKIQGSLYESSTFSCFHCNTVVHVPPKSDVNFVGVCRQCMKPICQECSRKVCLPWEKKMQQAEARYQALRSYGEAE